MNTDDKTGNWCQFVDEAKEKWGRRPAEAWRVVKHTRVAPAEKIRERVDKIGDRYGIPGASTERQARRPQ